MNISLSWLSAMLGRPLDAADVAHRLAMLGAPAESIEPLHQDLGDVMVGLVERVEKHPNADRLTLCSVNTGREVLDVVCGARNVQAGHQYPFAPVGAVLPGGVKLDARSIRGVASQGMLCSARELGLGTDHEGILELHTDAAPGTPLLQALPLADTRLRLDVGANRPDLLGHRGVARELGAVYGLPVKLPAVPGAAPEGLAPRRVERQGGAGGIDVAIEDTAGCPRYIAAVIRGVRVGPSPAWLEARLRAVGARPINNVVDATNYILYELNQPLHAFDLARLRGGTIVIRPARPGERITTLDGEVRELTADMTMICDAEGPQAVGGVMGGRDSEVSAGTTDLVLECAYFDPKRIRKTRKALRLITEASYRFERGTDMQAMSDVVRRAVSLIRTVAGGDEREAPVDVYPVPQRPRAVFLRPERVEHLLGMAVARDEIERHLAGVGFTSAPKNGRLHVQVPGWRPDVTREVDLIEEVARLKGYDAFPVELRPFRPSGVPDDPIELLGARLRRLLTGYGLHEARTLPLTSAGDDPTVVRILNPISQDHTALRSSLLPALVRGVEHNWSIRQRDVRLFEIGHVFQRPRGASQPEETLHLAAVLSGARDVPHWSNGFRPPDYDVWDVKAMFAEAARLGGPAGDVVTADDGWILRDPSGGERGRAGALSADRPAWAGPVYGFELELEARERPAVRYAALGVTPPVERDISLMLPEGVIAEQVEAVLQEAGTALLERAVAFDEYRGPGVDGRSVAWRLVFRAPDRTLKDHEVDEVVGRILARLKVALGVVRREA